MVQQIISPEQAFLPQEWARSSVAPVAAAVEQYGKDNYNTSALLLQQAQTKELQDAHLEAESRIASARDKMYLDREDARVKGQLARMDAREHGDAIRAISTKILSEGGALPERGTMTDIQYLDELARAGAKMQLGKHNGAIGALDASQKKIDAYQSEIEKAVGTINPNELRSTAGQIAISSLPEFYKQLDESLGQGKGEQFQALVAKLGGAATPEGIAVLAQRSGLGPHWSAFSGKAAMAAQRTLQEALVSKSDYPQIRGLYEAMTSEQKNQDRIAASNPQALSDWSEQRAMAKSVVADRVREAAAATGAGKPVAPSGGAVAPGAAERVLQTPSAQPAPSDQWTGVIPTAARAASGVVPFNPNALGESADYVLGNLGIAAGNIGRGLFTGAPQQPHVTIDDILARQPQGNPVNSSSPPMTAADYLFKLGVVYHDGHLIAPSHGKSATAVFGPLSKEDQVRRLDLAKRALLTPGLPKGNLEAVTGVNGYGYQNPMIMPLTAQPAPVEAPMADSLGIGLNRFTNGPLPMVKMPPVSVAQPQPPVLADSLLGFRPNPTPAPQPQPQQYLYGPGDSKPEAFNPFW